MIRIKWVICISNMWAAPTRTQRLATLGCDDGATEAAVRDPAALSKLVGHGLGNEQGHGRARGDRTKEGALLGSGSLVHGSVLD